jgi:hypothetical protein
MDKRDMKDDYWLIPIRGNEGGTLNVKPANALGYFFGKSGREGQYLLMDVH